MFVVFEGIDGSGKTHFAKMLFDYWQRTGVDALLVREPGGHPVSEKVRSLIMESEGLSLMSEVFLFSAARAQLVNDVIRPALEKGTFVICDRFTLSTLVYQGFCRDASWDDLTRISGINRMATQGLTPDLTILLDVAPEIGLSRKHAHKQDLNRFDKKDLDFHHKAREGYFVMAEYQNFPRTVIYTNPNLEIEQIFEHIRAEVDYCYTKKQVRPSRF